MSQRWPSRRLIHVRLYWLVNEHQPAFDSLHFQLASNRLFPDYMVKSTGELLPLPPVAAEPPANPEPPAGPLTERVAQPVAANQVISSLWRISFVLSLSPVVLEIRVSKRGRRAHMGWEARREMK